MSEWTIGEIHTALVRTGTSSGRSYPEAYLRDLFRILAHWPRDRYLELAPKYWLAPRARLDAGELALHIGPLTVSPPQPSEEQPASR